MAVEERWLDLVGVMVKGKGGGSDCGRCVDNKGRLEIDFQNKNKKIQQLI